MRNTLGGATCARLIQDNFQGAATTSTIMYQFLKFLHR